MNRSKPEGMPRSNFKGFRYKRIQEQYLTGDANEDNRILLEEFENIAAGLNDLAGRGAAAEEGFAQAVAAGGAAGGTGKDTDRMVALSDEDAYPDVLLMKMVEGPGIRFRVQGPGRKGGPFVEISTTGEELITTKANFNTYLDGEGNVLPPDDPLRLQITFLHDIPHEDFLFDMYRPYESTEQPETEDLHLDGSERGRFQIRWKNIERKPYRLTVWLHRPEFGTCVIYGSRTVRTGQVHRVLVE